MYQSIFYLPLYLKALRTISLSFFNIMLLICTTKLKPETETSTKTAQIVSYH